MLKKITSLLWLLFVLAAVFLGAWVVVDNDSLVVFNLFGFVLPQQTLGLLVLVAFSAGLLLGLFANVLITSWMVFKLARLQKRVQKQETKNTAVGKSA